MKYVFVIVGVGGTGSLLARDLPKILINLYDNKILLVDGDIVEEKNMERQSYQKHDIGEYKADALAKKMNTFYGNVCSSLPIFITKNELVMELSENYKGYIPVIIGCVDNDKTRMLLEDTFKELCDCIYIDSANSEYEGNIYVVKKRKEVIEGAIRSDSYKLKSDVHPSEKSCEEQAAAGNTQFLITNLQMASSLLEHIDLILENNGAKVGVTSVKRFEKIHFN